jgi:type I restriction enzyme, S subunit
VKKSIEPGSDAYQEEGVPFIRVSNLNKMGLSEPDIHLDGTKYKDVIKPLKDTILISKDGTVGIAYKVTEDTNAITSGAILHLSIKPEKRDDVKPDYLTLVLNSKVVQMQAERDAGGSILQHWKPSEIEQVEIPIIDIQIQEKIASLVSESFTLKKQSEQLLETAKRAVEIAIEENEGVAMQFINQLA